MYRVYDKNKKQWINDDVFLAPNDDLYINKKTIFGNDKLFLLPKHRFVYQKNILVRDRNNKYIYEGDIVETPSGKIGLIAYSDYTCSYVFLHCKESKYYLISLDSCKDFKIIGNLFDNSKLLPELASE